MKTLLPHKIIGLILLSIILTACGGGPEKIASATMLGNEQQTEYSLKSIKSSLNDYIASIEVASNFKIIKDPSIDYNTVYEINIRSNKGWEDILYQLIFNIGYEVDKLSEGEYKIRSI